MTVSSSPSLPSMQYHITLLIYPDSTCNGLSQLTSQLMATPSFQFRGLQTLASSLAPLSSNTPHSIQQETLMVLSPWKWGQLTISQCLLCLLTWSKPYHLSWLWNTVKSPTCKASSCRLTKMWTRIPSMSGMSKIAACPSSSTADDLLVLPSPSPFPLLVRNSSCLFLMPGPVCQLLYYTTVLFKVMYCKVEIVLKIFYVCFLYIIYVKNIIELL